MLEEDQRFNSQYFIDNILQKIYEMASDSSNEAHRKIILHFDNARPHTSRKVKEYMDLHKKTPPSPLFPGYCTIRLQFIWNHKGKIKALYIRVTRRTL